MRALSVMDLLLVGCLVLGLVSCGDDDDGIVGIWHLYSLDGETPEDDEEAIFEFDADGTFTLRARDGESAMSLMGTYSLSADVVTMDVPGDGVGTATWFRNGNTLTLITMKDSVVLVLKQKYNLRQELIF